MGEPQEPKGPGDEEPLVRQGADPGKTPGEAEGEESPPRQPPPDPGKTPGIAEGPPR